MGVGDCLGRPLGIRLQIGRERGSGYLPFASVQVFQPPVLDSASGDSALELELDKRSGRNRHGDVEEIVVSRPCTVYTGVSAGTVGGGSSPVNPGDVCPDKGDGTCSYRGKDGGNSVCGGWPLGIIGVTCR